MYKTQFESSTQPFEILFIDQSRLLAHGIDIFKHSSFRSSSKDGNNPDMALKLT